MSLLAWIKRVRLRTVDGDFIQFKDKSFSRYRYLLGGIVFGLGWALSGACPGPMFTLVGYGYGVFVVVILSAILGTYVYGRLRPYLPH